jgi:hypothetical protein
MIGAGAAIIPRESADDPVAVPPKPDEPDRVPPEPDEVSAPPKPDDAVTPTEAVPADAAGVAIAVVIAAPCASPSWPMAP